MKAKSTIVTLCAVLCGLTAAADETRHRALAEELLDAMNVKENIEQSVERMKEFHSAQLSQASQANPDAAAEIKTAQDEIIALVADELNWDNLKNDYIDVYTDLFTEEELSGLIEFYNTDLGKKFISTMPELSQRSVEINQRQMAEIGPKVQELVGKLRALGTGGPRSVPAAP